VSKNLVVMLVVVLLFVTGCQQELVSVVNQDVSPDYRVAVLMAENETDKGWNMAHWRGFESAMDRLGLAVEAADRANSYLVSLNDGDLLQVDFYKDIGYNEADIDKALRDAIKSSPNQVFTTWWDSGLPTSRIAEEYSDTWFHNASTFPFTSPDVVEYDSEGKAVEREHENYSTYMIRIEQGDYAAGWAACLMKDTKVGVVITFPIPEPVRGASAFTDGMIDCLMEEEGLDYENAVEQVHVQLQYIFSWLDRVGEQEATVALLDTTVEGTENKFTAIRQMADTPYASQVACENGASAYGYGSTPFDVAPCAYLSTNWEWGEYYYEMMKSMIDGTLSKGFDWWGGFPEGAVGFVWNDNVPDSVVTRVNQVVSELEAGANILCGPFQYYGKAGDGFVPAGQCLSDRSMLEMSFYLRGMYGNLPDPPGGQYVIELINE